jgi:hypothetical protein
LSEDLPQRTATEQVLLTLTRLICEPGDVEGEQAVIAGTEIVLSNEPEKGVLNAPLDYRREVKTSAESSATC